MEKDEGEQDKGIRHRTRSECPMFCQQFDCILKDNCNKECEKLDFARAMICELCGKDCTEKQKMVFLNTEYFKQKRREFSQNVMDGINEVKVEHTILERKYIELKKKLLLTTWYNIPQKTAIVGQGNAVIKELLLLRKFMDMLHIKYDKEVDLEGKGN